MAIPWIRKIREGGKLSVWNKANTWTDAVNAAIEAFNRLSFGVSLVKSKDEIGEHCSGARERAHGLHLSGNNRDAGRRLQP